MPHHTVAAARVIESVLSNPNPTAKGLLLAMTHACKTLTVLNLEMKTGQFNIEPTLSVNLSEYASQLQRLGTETELLLVKVGLSPTTVKHYITPRVRKLRDNLDFRQISSQSVEDDVRVLQGMICAEASNGGLGKLVTRRKVETAALAVVGGVAVAVVASPPAGASLGSLALLGILGKELLAGAKSQWKEQ